MSNILYIWIQFSWKKPQIKPLTALSVKYCHLQKNRRKSWIDFQFYKDGKMIWNSVVKYTCYPRISDIDKYTIDRCNAGICYSCGTFTRQNDINYLQLLMPIIICERSDIETNTNKKNYVWLINMVQNTVKTIQKQVYIVWGRSITIQYTEIAIMFILQKKTTFWMFMVAELPYINVAMTILHKLNFNLRNHSRYQTAPWDYSLFADQRSACRYECKVIR